MFRLCPASVSSSAGARRMPGFACDPSAAATEAALDRLCAEHRRLRAAAGDALDLRGEAAYAACESFLRGLDRAARALDIPMASRGYRASFTPNYRALFPDNGRSYNVDVLETGLDRHSELWVNGDKFELSEKALTRASALKEAWLQLCFFLDQWQQTEEPRPSPTEAVLPLYMLDEAWAHFEECYICELIEIENRARHLLIQASSLEARLRCLEEVEERGEEVPEGKEAIERELVELIARLNSVANFKCKGRDDLGYDILDSARRVMRRCDRASWGGGCQAALAAARVLATDVLGAYRAMRDYLRNVGSRIERVDPHLCNNPGLVARLVDWETSWEVGARYVRDAPLMRATCDIVAGIKGAQALVPALAQMCEDCDVELFLALPRIVLLLFAANPHGARAELLRSLLPHRFEGDHSAGVGAGPTAELGALAAKFREVCDIINDGKGSPAAWNILIRRAVSGSSEDDSIYGGCGPAAREGAEGLMHDLEKWSLELQRHCPQDWNQCSAVLLQCLTGRGKQKPRVRFEV